MAKQPKPSFSSSEPEATLGHGHNGEKAEVLQLRRIADALEEGNDILKNGFKCICDALQPPSAQSATLVINQIIKGIKESK